MDEEVRKRLEYEEQFFGISSLFFSDCFKQFVKDEVESKITVLIGNLKSKLLHQAKSPDQFVAALQEMKRSLSVEYFKVLDKLFPEINSKISILVSIPSNILLKEDLPVKYGMIGDLNEIKNDIETLKGTFTSLLYLKQKLIEELQEADSAILCVEYFVKDEKFNFDFSPIKNISVFSNIDKGLISDNL